MRYPIAIEVGDKKHAYGVVVPDLPGCFSAGDTLEEALSNYMHYDLGFFDHQSSRVECAPNPFSAKVLFFNNLAGSPSPQTGTKAHGRAPNATFSLRYPESTIG